MICGSHLVGGWMAKCVWKTSLKQTLKCFVLFRYSSCTPFEIYASSRGYRQFQVSTLQFCDSLKTPSAEDFVGLHCLVGCTVTAAEGVGTNHKWSMVQVVLCVVNQSILFQTEITNVFKVCSTACEVCARSFLYLVCILWRFTCECVLNVAGSMSAW